MQKHSNSKRFIGHQMVMVHMQETWITWINGGLIDELKEIYNI